MLSISNKINFNKKVCVQTFQIQFSGWMMIGRSMVMTIGRQSFGVLAIVDQDHLIEVEGLYRIYRCLGLVNLL